jgi:hypothetical protein
MSGTSGATRAPLKGASAHRWAGSSTVTCTRGVTLKSEASCSPVLLLKLSRTRSRVALPFDCTYTTVSREFCAGMSARVKRTGGASDAATSIPVAAPDTRSLRFD